MKVNFSIPVTLFNYRESDNPLYSFAKLKIFYIGVTPDKRLFTKDFSDSLIKSLPYVPVVGYYSEDKKDFLGHNEKIQHIYGVVPEATGVEYVKEGNKEYAVCDVILYTGRKDETGEIAQKIVGKQHSLELNPTNTTYKINKNSEGKVENIEFITGTLIGLSVLGDNEKPAFTGSEFFTENEELETIFNGLKEQVAQFVAHIKKRGENMDFDVFESALAFIKKSYTEKRIALATSLRDIYGEYFYIQELFDNYVVVGVWSDEKGAVVYNKLTYSLEENDKVVFGIATEVFPRYLTVEEIAKWEANGSDFALNPKGVENTPEGTQEKEDEHNGTFSQVDGATTPDAAEIDQVTGSVENVEQTGTTKTETGVFSTNEEEHTTTGENVEENTKPKQEEEKPQNFSTSTLSDSEREELNALRQEVGQYRTAKKLGLVESFSEDLDSKFIENLKAEIVKYEYEQLEVILAKEFTRKQKELQVTKTQKFSPFVYNGNGTSTSEDKNSIIKRLVETHK